jgi:hypothetical protein
MNRMELAAHHTPERDDNKLSILRAILNIVGDNRHVPKVQRGIYFVHEIKRCGLIVQETQPQHFLGERINPSP